MNIWTVQPTILHYVYDFYIIISLYISEQFVNKISTDHLDIKF